ncbi:MAG TPA: hypothetical protein VFY56_05515 [Propionibacteriaceae bacterium]|nr:hypothetical protein [Propionibacteriaceae bacterium]
MADHDYDTTAEVTLRPIDIDDWAAVHEWASTIEACRYQAWGPQLGRRDESLRRSGGQPVGPRATGPIRLDL